MRKWDAACKIADARRPRGDVAMTETMMLAQTVVEMRDIISELESENALLVTAIKVMREEMNAVADRVNDLRWLPIDAIAAKHNSNDDGPKRRD